MLGNENKAGALGVVGASLILLLMASPRSALPQMTPCSVPPPDLPNGNYTPVGIREVEYSCNDKFWLSGPSILTCNTTTDGKDAWLPDMLLECLPHKDCPEIELEHGGYDNECCVPGDNVTFYCDDDERYILLGAPTATCLPNGVWSVPTPTCHDTFCRDPGGILEGYRRPPLPQKSNDEVFHPPGTVMTYECNKDYKLEGENQTTCGENGTWTHETPKCKPPGACESFELENGQVSGEKSGGEFFAPGDSAFITCNRGFKVNGTDQLSCMQDGRWDDVLPSCVEYNCTRFVPGPHLKVDEFKDPNNTAFPEGTSINFRCDDGYLLVGVFSFVCQNGGWYGRMPKCEQIRCGALRSPQHGWMTGNYSTAIGATANIGCFQGYKLMGDNKRVCEPDGQWTGEPARCIPSVLLDARRQRGCPDPGAPDNGRRLGHSAFLFPIGSRVTFACNRGYHMRGHDIIACLPKGNWSTELPRCIGKFYYDRSPVVRGAVNDAMNDIPQNFSDNTAHNATGRSLVVSGPDPDRHYVYFLFDASTSIGEKNFRTGINLAKAITRKVNVTATGHRVGAIVFSTNAKLEIDAIRIDNQDLVLRRLDAINYTHGGTSINNALVMLKNNIANVKNQLYYRNDPSKLRKLKIAAFLITDGKANIGGDAQNVAGELRQMGNVEIYCIGITGANNPSALQRLANPQENVFILRDYDSLQWLADELTNGTKDYGKCGLSYSHDPSTGFREDDPAARILGGQQVKDSWPWMVAISTSEHPDQVFCGGTIIHKKWILTAAHCTHRENNYTANELFLQEGLIQRNSRGQKKLQVKRIVVHDGYRNATFLNDIALLELKNEIVFEEKVRPICLPLTKDVIENMGLYRREKPAFVIGWGEAENKIPAKHLMQLQVEIGDHANCSETATKLKTPFIPEQGQMCARSSEGDTCSGDSGGPLMQGFEDEEKIWTQVGIVSWGRVGCKQDDNSFYTDVSQYMDWILNHTAGLK